MLLTLSLVDEDGVSGSFHSEVGSLGLQGTLGKAHGGSVGLVGVSSTFQVVLSGQVSANGLGGCSESES